MAAKLTNMTVQLLTPEEEAIARLDGTFDPSKLTITAELKLDVPVEFIKLDFIIEPRADHAERLKTCAEFEPGEPKKSNLCQTDGHYLCQECTHIAIAKTTAAVEAAAAEEARLREEERLAKEAAKRLAGTYPRLCVHCGGALVGEPPRCTRCRSYRGDR
jgi:hypothetical protein